MFGCWVLDMVYTSSKNCRIFVVENREASILINIMKEHILIGSEIHTDCFRSYADLATEGYTHKAVNHSVEFVGEIFIRLQFELGLG